MIYNLQNIAQIVQGKLTGNGQAKIEQILIDSRNITYGTGSLFFALRGERNDGHNHIESLIANNVKSFVISSPALPERFPNANFILVDDTLAALQLLAAHHRKQFQIPVIGITGSNGKTIVKEWLAQAIGEDKRVVKSPRSFNSQVGVPLSIWQLDNTADLGIFEAGISLPGEMERLQEIINPTIGIITNIGEAHQENFADYRTKASEKLKLFNNSEVIIFCRDHEVIWEIINTENALKAKKLFTWSMQQKADLQIILLKHNSSGVDIEANFSGQNVTLNIPFLDDASIENAIHVCAAMLFLGYPFNEVQHRLSGLNPVAMRMEMKKGINKCTLINDSYNSDILSLRTAIEFLLRQKQNSRKTIILSDIQQSGKTRQELYSKVAGLVNNEAINRLICIGPDLFSSQKLFPVNTSFYLSTGDFLASMDQFRFQDEAILIKGARSFRFETVSEKLEEVVHQTVLEVDFNALVHNLNYFRSLLKPGTKIMVMVKALAYGSGSYEIAQLLNHHRVDYLGVAFADEGIALRRAGISIPVMIMGPDENALEKIIEYNLEPEIYNLKMARLFSEKVKAANMKQYPIHLKIDTGMHRLGFLNDEMDELIELLTRHPNLHVKSVFSHLAASDSSEFDDFTEQQVKLFNFVCNKLNNALGYTYIKHILNSSGIERFAKYQLDMVRLGIGLYGISAINSKNLKHISTLKSTIIQIKRLDKKETVGYSRRGSLQRDSVIAIVPVGYADGVNRKLGNGNWQVVINGKNAPTVGNICMDLMMVDITDIQANEGDNVIIFGEMNTISDIAQKLETIPYEILTGISGRVKRLYYHE